VRGRSTESIIAALLYTTCREEGAPRTLDEISRASGINRRDIGKTYRYISRKLSIRILPARPQDYIPRFGSLLDLDEAVQVRGISILDDATKFDVTSGKGPIGVAAAALYIAAVLEGRRKTQREVADAIGVTEVTIRNRYKEIIDHLGIKDEVEEKVREEESEKESKK
jgi:transcription initiation factor TFIIB